MLRRLAAIAAPLLFALSAQGCSLELGEDSAGDAGRLRFQYAGEDCLFGCSMSREVLAGSAIDLTVTNLDPSLRYDARLVTSELATAKARESCSCTARANGESRSRSVEPGETCGSGETKSCSLGVTLETRRAGDVKLEVLEGGRYVDSITVKVRDPERLASTLRSGGADLVPASDGAYEVKLDARVEMKTEVRSASGEDLLFTGHGVDVKFLDERVVGPLAFEIFGRSDTAVGQAKALGEARVSITAGSRTELVRLRVVR